MRLDRTSRRLVVGLGACCAGAGLAITLFGARQLGELSAWYDARLAEEVAAVQAAPQAPLGPRLDAVREDAAAAFDEALLPIGVFAVILVLGCSTGAAVGALWLQARLEQFADRLKDIADGDGDLTQRIELPRGDAMGELAYGFNAFVGRVEALVQNIGGTAAELATSAGGLAQAAHSLNGSADTLEHRARHMHGMTGEMASGAGRVAEVMGGAAQDLQDIAAAAEQIRGSVESASTRGEDTTQHIGALVDGMAEVEAAIRVIVEHISQTAQISRDNRKLVDETLAAMKDLDEGVAQVGGILDLIGSIAAQTDLLALNATIEAAGAGEAGRGFAVVAQEIKGLSAQTAAATGRIGGQLEAMRAKTRLSATRLERVEGLSDQLVASTDRVAEEIEQQSMATHEIMGRLASSSSVIRGLAEDVAMLRAAAEEVARSAGSASHGVGVAARSAQDLSGQTQSVANDTDDARTAAVGLVDQASSVDHAADALETRASALQAIVRSFKVA